MTGLRSKRQYWVIVRVRGLWCKLSTKLHTYMEACEEIDRLARHSSANYRSHYCKAPLPA